jgi:hypothetical protein
MYICYTCVLYAYYKLYVIIIRYYIFLEISTKIAKSDIFWKRAICRNKT